MATYILDNRGNAIPASWEEFAAWYFDKKDELIIARDDIRDKRRRYVTTVTTKYRGIIENPAESDKPLVWVTETADGGEAWFVATRREAEVNHKRMVRLLENCYCHR